MGFVQNSRFWQIGDGETRAHCTIAKVRIFDVDKVAGVHKANALEDLITNQQTARRSMLHWSGLIELPVIGFAVTMMKTGIRSPRVEAAACAPDLVLVVMKHDLRRDHVTGSSIDARNQCFQQFKGTRCRY